MDATSPPTAPTEPEAPNDADAAAGGGATGPGIPTVDIGGWPTWVRRSVIGVAMAIAIGVAVWGANAAGPSEEGQGLGPAIVTIFPVPGAQALRQTEVGVDLANGYDGRLTINGIQIPESQMEGAIDPRSVSPDELKKLGIRPNNRNRVYFKPGPGKVIESFTTGKVTITVRYFRDRQETTDGGSFTWTIRVD